MTFLFILRRLNRCVVGDCVVAALGAPPSLLFGHSHLFCAHPQQLRDACCTLLALSPSPAPPALVAVAGAAVVRTLLSRPLLRTAAAAAATSGKVALMHHAQQLSRLVEHPCVALLRVGRRHSLVARREEHVLRHLQHGRGAAAPADPHAALVVDHHDVVVPVREDARQRLQRVCVAVVARHDAILEQRARRVQHRHHARRVRPRPVRVHVQLEQLRHPPQERLDARPQLHQEVQRTLAHDRHVRRHGAGFQRAAQRQRVQHRVVDVHHQDKAAGGHQRLVLGAAGRRRFAVGDPDVVAAVQGADARKGSLESADVLAAVGAEPAEHHFVGAVFG
eukprot:Rhum_TRINITY_DN13897_c0_g1::Rhum_TRINITY_DN13897_c0_g1_i1::g.65437::m.65437